MTTPQEEPDSKEQEAKSSGTERVKNAPNLGPLKAVKTVANRIHGGSGEEGNSSNS